MASYRSWTGKIDYEAASKDIENAKSYGAAYDIIEDVIKDAKHLGVTNSDQAAVAWVLSTFAFKFNLSNNEDMTKLINSWDESTSDFKSANAFNIDERMKSDINTLQNIVTTGNASGKTNTNTNTNKNNTGTGSTSSGTKPSTTTTTGGTTSTKPPANNTNATTTKTETPVEKPVYEGADAVAKRHGIDYNLENTLADYNQRTNDYYDAATAEYEADRTRYVQASNNYANRIMDEYLDSYANATATAAGRGATAAAALMTDLNTQSVNAANDLGMLQTINNLNEARKAELVKNKYLAEQYYNDLGIYLSQVSTAQYGADVNKYVKAMDAYAQQYAADRALAENEARAASTKYAGLANASAYKSSQVSSTAAWDRLYNYYLTRFNGNETMASNAVINNLGNQKAGDK